MQNCPTLLRAKDSMSSSLRAILDCVTPCEVNPNLYYHQSDCVQAYIQRLLGQIQLFCGVRVYW